jgi:nucleoid-associated protein YgaU
MNAIPRRRSPFDSFDRLVELASAANAQAQIDTAMSAPSVSPTDTTYTTLSVRATAEQAAFNSAFNRMVADDPVLAHLARQPEVPPHAPGKPISRHGANQNVLDVTAREVPDDGTDGI